MSRPSGEISGLQAERTALSWDRTLLGILANGALVLLHHTNTVHPSRIIAAVFALLVAGLCMHARRRRTASMRRLAAGRQRVVPASREVLMLGIGVAALCLLVGALTVVEALTPVD